MSGQCEAGLHILQKLAESFQTITVTPNPRNTQVWSEKVLNTLAKEVTGSEYLP